ncbi:MAG: hypothetical protein RJB38_335 [Pseudomonadota bacterium]
MSSSSDWTTLKDEELLQVRICDLHLEISGSWLEERVKTLQQELKEKGLRLLPRIYLGDEWFSPSGIVAIAIPFYLAHPRLMALEKKMMLEVEGGSPDWCAKLLRHEAGHCFDHAYGFSKTRKWRRTFGSPDLDYAPESYRPKPYSKSFVKNLENWYAQAHPDEDFAETFAVWLAPDRSWRQEYTHWPMALKKLDFVDALATEYGQKSYEPAKGRLPFESSRMKTTLGHYYAKRKREHAEAYPDFYDGDLKRIFSGPIESVPPTQSAARFMTKNRKMLIETVGFWTRERKITLESLIKKLEQRCRELELQAGLDDAKTSMEVATYLATLVTHYRFTGKFKRTV